MDEAVTDGVNESAVRHQHYRVEGVAGAHDHVQASIQLYLDELLAAKDPDLLFKQATDNLVQNLSTLWAQNKHKLIPVEGN